MKDRFRAAHFDLSAQVPNSLTDAEQKRICETLALVPPAWDTIVDVGCGDGRVSRQLLAHGREVVGLDWCLGSVAQFEGKSALCDLRAPWPFKSKFDGAICCEVLEHLLPHEASRVIEQIRSSVSGGFVVTVPAREPFASNVVFCERCANSFHIWGHLRTFGSFREVDELVGQTAVARRLIPSPSRVRVPGMLATWRNRHGLHPWDPSYICPHCGLQLVRPGPSTRSVRAINKLVTAVAYASAPFRRRGGWFACLYMKAAHLDMRHRAP